MFYNKILGHIIQDVFKVNSLQCLVSKCIVVLIIILNIGSRVKNDIVDEA